MGEQQEASLFATAVRAFPLLRKVEPRGYLVGGAVRDLLLGREPRDADVAIRGAADAASRFAKDAGARMVRLGAEPFEVIRVVARGAIYDFAEIVGDTIEADLGRRDFTIGAIALPLAPPHELVDPFGGRRDLESATLRTVRESNFSDDPLRVVRGLRLMAELALTIDPATLDAMRRYARQAVDVAPERLGVEWLALLSASSAEALHSALALVRELGLELSFAGAPLEEAAMEAAVSVGGSDPVTRLAALALLGDGDALCATSMRLGLGASRVDAVKRAAGLARRLAEAAPAAAVDRVALHDAGEEATRRAIALLRATGRRDVSDELGSLVSRDGVAIFAMRPLLDGDRIGAETGIAPGPRIGAIRRALLEAQLRGEIGNEAEAREFVLEKSIER
ncbi:MAG: hypothetical protein NDJ92_19910 [Thermoanaerobaculia bacterium]|nr:hypothetical protein [Thermoanaerobaculia bacterium]